MGGRFGPEYSHKDFSIATIGKKCELAGIFKARILYNASESDFQTLIKAWANFSGPFPSVPDPVPSKTQQLLERIQDRAIRSSIQYIITDRERLKVENNLLRSKVEITIDRRPTESSPRWPSSSRITLTESEIDALKQAISQTFISDQGWKEGEHGEVHTLAGRLVFDVGYTIAIRKILEHFSKLKQKY